MKCIQKCEWQIQPPWGELSYRQQSPWMSSHLQKSSPLSSPSPLAFSDGSGQLTFNVTSWGNPRAPPVFLVHGRQDCAATFQPLLDFLDPEEFYYVSIDMPGSGNSTPLPVGMPLQSINNATLTMSNALKTTICRSSQKRKHGMKLTKIPDDSIVCNDHGSRQCRFAKPAYITEKEFVHRGYKRPIMKRYLQNRLARGWSVLFRFRWGPVLELFPENQDDRVSEISALSPITEYTVGSESVSDSESDSSTDCELFDCPHLPPGLLRELHDFYKNRQMSNNSERPAAVPYVNGVQQSHINAQNLDSPSIYEPSPQLYAYIREIHNYARSPDTEPWFNYTVRSPVRQNPRSYDTPPINDLIPQRDTIAPESKLFNREYITRRTSILSPEGSTNYGAVALPGLYTPIGTAPGYDYEYMYPDRETREPDQNRPNCLLPWAYSNPFTPMAPNRFVPCPLMPNGLPCCFFYDNESLQESIPSEEQEENNDDFDRTTDDFNNAEVAGALGYHEEEARVYRDPGRGSGKTWRI